MIDTAIDVATPERARYFVERIARTEKVRAYMDGQCNHMPMIPTVWLSGGNFRAAIHVMTFVTCTYTDLWGMDEGIFQNDCWHHAGKAPMAFKEKGSSDFSGIPKHMGGSDEAGNHDPLAGSDSASIFIFFHPKAQHICYNNSNIVKF